MPGTDAGQSGAHDDHVEVGRRVRRRRLHQAAPISLSFEGPSSSKSVADQASTNAILSLASGWKSEGWL